MFAIDRLIQISILILIVVSSTLLGMGLSNYWLTAIAIFSAVGGFFLVDLWKLFRLDGWLANIISLVILFIAMRNFIPEDSTGKLASVATLLVYLQSLLMFQVKSPRLIWQILMLSLLQVVVAAIFSIELEGGILFIIFFIVAGLALSLQLAFTNRSETFNTNRSSSQRLIRLIDEKRQVTVNHVPLFFYDPGKNISPAIRSLMLHVFSWMVIVIPFAIVLFQMVPRINEPWIGGAKMGIKMDDISKNVDLNNRGEIRQSTELVFRVDFQDLTTGEPVKLPDNLYFRSMALPDLSIADGRTNWRAPLDRISREHYDSTAVFWGRNRTVIQNITLEENRNPLFYSLTPFSPLPDTPENLEYCHEISAFVRCRFDEYLEVAPFRYQLATTVNPDGSMPESWPYYPNTTGNRMFPMSADPSELEWLTIHHADRYPALVALARQIANAIKQDNPGAGRREICKALESYFTTQERFRYTLDYRLVKRQDDLDPVEDFVRNHRSGHCEMFASALVLMLRSLDIPARYVIGFYGGDPHYYSDQILVRGNHAHAWVEAYLPPEECSAEMYDQGFANRGGAWLRLDSTPPTSNSSTVGLGGEAIGLARSIWQDYALGLNVSRDQRDSMGWAMPLANFFYTMGGDWDSMILKVDRSLQSTGLRYFLVGLIFFPPLIVWLLTAYLNYRSSQQGRPPVFSLRKLVADAVAIFAPNLGRWLAGQSSTTLPTPFYNRLIGILAQRGFTRKPTESHREFAYATAEQFSTHPQYSMIKSVILEISEIFNEVRFGKQPISFDLSQEIDFCLNELEKELENELEPTDDSVVDS